MNWTAPHTPQPPPPSKPASGDGSGSGSGSGDGSGSSGSGGTGSGSTPDDDPDSSYYNTPPGLQPIGYTYQPSAADYDSLEIETDGLASYEQNVLSAASNLVAQFNTLRDRAQNALSEEIWGRGEGVWQRQKYIGNQANNPNRDNEDHDPHFTPTTTALSARDFTKGIAPGQQAALQGAADMITLSGMYISVLDSTLSSYAQMDMMTVFPDPQDLKKGDSTPK